MKTDSDKKHIAKSISLFGGLQGLSILSGLIRNKVVASLLGPAGMGLISLYNNIVTLLNNVSVFPGPHAAMASSMVSYSVVPTLATGLAHALPAHVNASSRAANFAVSEPIILVSCFMCLFLCCFFVRKSVKRLWSARSHSRGRADGISRTSGTLIQPSSMCLALRRAEDSAPYGGAGGQDRVGRVVLDAPPLR